MERFSPYSQYKNSGLDWISQIPAHWDIRRNRFLFREIDCRSAHGAEEHLSMSQAHGLVPSKSLSRKSLQSESYAGGKLVSANDLVLNRLKAHLGVFARAKQPGVVSPDYTVLRPNGKADVHYCELLFKTPTYVAEFRRRTRGIVEGFWRLYTDDFYNIHTLFPPLEEQETIVTYLRTQDTKIARFIRIKRELIARLNEQKLRLVDHAITGGVNPSAPRKLSGVDWLGEVPGHWEVSKVKMLADYINGFAFNPSTWSDRGCPIIRIQNLTSREAPFNYYDGNLPERYRVRHGDILLSWSASLGVFVWDKGEAWLNQHIFKVVPDPKKITSNYFVLLATWFLEHMAKEAHGSTMQHITKPKFGSFPVPLPPLAEQHAILAHITTATDPLNAAITQAEQEITLIREYRERLIFDAVTGQIDLRGWQVPADGNTTDDDSLDVLVDQDTETLDTEEEDSHGDE